jgi:hypothetical protein
MSLRLLAVLSACFLPATSTALAAVITFDDLSAVGCPPSGTVPNGYAGLGWNNFGYTNATIFPCSVEGYGTALTSSPNVAFNVFGNPASITSVTPFTLVSGDFAAAWNDGLLVSITAKLGATTVGTFNFTLNTTTRVLETGFNFGPVTELDFSSSGGTPNPNLIQFGFGTQFALDNLAINPVPEPRTFWLMAFVIWMTALGRRRRGCLKT